MGLFNILKGEKQNLKDATDEWTVFAQKMCVTAVEYAKEFNKKLDYSETGIADLEEILDLYSKDIAISKPTENQIWSIAIIFGSYLGEALLRNGLSQKGFAWGREASSNVPLLIKDGGSYLAPNDKVYKRLVNGSEDSVVSFYRFAVKEV